MIITLKFDGRCADCGAGLRAGERARWYKNGKTYGLRCHGETERGTTRRGPRTAYQRGDRSPGARASHYDPYGIYTPDGTKIGTSCGCIDYPCCGH